MKILNKTDTPMVVKIVLADGTRDSVQLNRGRPLTLPPGAQVDPDEIANYMPFLKTDPPLEIPKRAAQVAEAEDGESDASPGNE